MMYSIKKLNDKEKWDEVASRFDNATFVLSWNYGEFEKSLGAVFDNYAVYDSNDSIVGLLPIKHVKALRGRYLHLRHAPLIDWENRELVAAVLKFLKKMAVKGAWQFVRISPLLSNTPLHNDLLKECKLIPATAHAVDAENTLVLDLSKSEDQLLAEMRKNTRYYIRKAEKMGIKVVSTTGMENFEQFWEIYQDAVSRNKWTAYSRNYIQKEFELFAKDNMARMFFTLYENKPIAAAIFIYFNGHSVYHHSGSLTQFREVPSTYLLQWEAIKYAKSAGMRIHNLWGVSPENQKEHPWYGLSLFKRGFGGSEVQTVHAHDMIVYPFAHATRVYENLENKRRGY
ncbi:MAG: peptidoglycan bridge formation glycyltransferase FemA/FemB family protein [Candidatus Dojkabacteria bacterium]|nr:MAG: peptidoglycan bridge formation glycyltransferase FemA/FemB family protein [Candidatus Dojkabacteria bacterium]